MQAIASLMTELLIPAATIVGVLLEIAGAIFLALCLIARFEERFLNLFDLQREFLAFARKRAIDRANAKKE